MLTCENHSDEDQKPRNEDLQNEIGDLLGEIETATPLVFCLGNLDFQRVKYFKIFRFFNLLNLYFF